MHKLSAVLATMKRDDLAKAITKLAASATIGHDEVLKALGTAACGSGPAEIAATSSKPRKAWKGAESLDFTRYRSRFVALHIMYLGHNYHGLASQASAADTIEAFLFDALVKRCLIESREKSAYSRCGRTDKGVSAFSQIITLRLRSKARTAGTLDKPTKTALEFDEELPPPAEEIDYPVVINSGLPEDIRVLGWCDMPETFSARFNARHRTYRYFFPKRSLDIDAMREGAKLLLGRHDFRNLCKIDVMHVDNFERVVYSARIDRMYETTTGGDSEHEMYYFEVCGTAFLWHQVRCMMGVLFLIGRRLEAPDVISKLLDVSTLPGKPNYEMAPDIPLMLYGCEYESLHVHRSANTLSKVVNDLEAQWSRHSIIAAQIRTALNAINGFKVVDTSVTPAGPVLGKTSSGITLLTTDHMPYDVAFRGGKSVVEVAAGAGTEAGDNPAGTSACERTTVAAWLAAAGLKPDISCEYPLAGTYTPLLSRKTAPSVAAKLSGLSEAKKRKRQEDHPNFYSDDEGES